MKFFNMTIIVLLLISTITSAKKEPARTIKQILPAKERAYTLSGKSFSLASGLPSMFANINYQAKSKTPEAIANEYIANNLDLLQLNKSHTEELRLVNVRKGLATTTVRYKQFYQGIEVFNSDIAVSFDKNNVVNYVANSLKPVMNFKGFKSNKSIKVIESIALDYLGFDFVTNKTSLKEVIYLHDNNYISAFKLDVFSSNLKGEWLFVINATDGEILIAKDTLSYVNGTTTVFDPDPLSTSGQNYGGGLRDGNDTTTAALDAQLFSKTIDVTQTGNTYFLKNQWAESIDFENPSDGIYSQNNSNFNYNRGENPFESANVYYHIDKYMKYLNVELGLDAKPYQYSGGVKFDAHGKNGADNSTYSSTGRLAYGEGCVDDAEDADVIIHELGHGIHDWVTNGNLSTEEGLSEGTGDYFAQSYSRSLENFVWNSNQPAYHYVYSWDGHNECWGGRTTNYNRTYPGGLVNQIHSDGQIWATCLMKVWDQIGKENTDTIVVEGLAMTGSNTNQQQAAQAVLQASVDVGLNQHVATIQSTLQSCGYDVSVQQASFSATITTVGNASINSNQTFNANVIGGVSPYTYVWDVNNDESVDGNGASIEVNYQQAHSGTVTVQITDSQNVSISSSLAVNIKAPKIDMIQAGSATQVCGNGNSVIDPGERWKVPVQMQNNGFVGASNAYAVFKKNNGSENFIIQSTDNYGNSTANCSSKFIDISSSGKELVFIDSNPNDSFPANDEGVAPVTLSQSFNLYGQSIQGLYLSSNGYISTDPSDSGVDYDNSCPIPSAPSSANINNGVSTYAKLMPLHDDLIVQHLYYQHYSTCPRQSSLAQNLPCDIFMYQDVDIFDSSNTVIEHFNFEAILYPTVSQWVYQYDGVGFNSASSSVGMQNDDASDGLSFSCNAAGTINTQQAICLYHRDHQPSIGSPGEVSTVNLETPVLDIGNLQVSGQHNSFVEFSINENAECGSPINISMEAVVYSDGFNQTNAEIINQEIGNNGSCGIVTKCLASNANSIQPKNGLWYNPKRSGNGSDLYFLQNNQGPKLFNVYYTGDKKHAPIWYLSNDEGYYQNDQAYNQMRKISYNGPFSTTSQQTSTVVGDSLITLVNQNKAVQTRNVNGKFSAEIIETFVFANGVNEQRSGLWYSESEAGWGETIVTQGNTQVVVNYLYDNSGNPYWILGLGENEIAESLDMKYFKPFCPHCPAISVASESVGTFQLRYNSDNKKGVIESMQINITNDDHTSQWNRSNLPVNVLIEANN